MQCGRGGWSPVGHGGMAGHGGGCGHGGHDHSQSKGQSKTSHGRKFCGEDHSPNKCPAWGKECHKWGRKILFESKCCKGINKSQSRDKSQQC